MATTDVAAIAEKVYNKCLQGPQAHLFQSYEIQDMDPRLASATDAQHVINHLLNEGLFKIMMQGRDTVFKVVPKEVAGKLGSLSSDELIIYEHIEAAGREGIWTKVLKTRTNQHQTVLTKCLKSLENRRFIKCIKSVKVGK